MDPITKQGQQSADDPMEFILSEESVDRVGDIIRADGWKLSDFRKNPIALFGHRQDHVDNIIGVWKDVRIVGKQLRGKLHLAKEGTSKVVDTVRSLVEQRILKAVSVGALPIEAVPRDPDKPWRGIDYKKAMLTEASLVPVPAHPNAVAVAKALSPEIADIIFARSGSNGDVDNNDGDKSLGRVTFDMKTPNLERARIRAKQLGIAI